MRYRQLNFLQEKMKRISSLYELRSVMDLMKLETREAYLESDIIWENVGKNQAMARVKRVSLFALLIVFSLIVLTPTYAVNLLDPLKFAIHDVIKVSWVQQAITTYFSPLIVILFNFVIIPSLIDLSV